MSTCTPQQSLEANGKLQNGPMCSSQVACQLDNSPPIGLLALPMNFRRKLGEHIWQALKRWHLRHGIFHRCGHRDVKHTHSTVYMSKW